MIVFTYQQGHGLRSAMLSIGLSLALMAVNYIQPHILIGCVLTFVVLSFLFGEHYSRVWRDFCRSLRPSETPADMDAVLTRLRLTPTELWEPADQLSVHELRRRVRPRNPPPLERSDLEDAYNSDFDVCSICAEPWAPGDVYRQLKTCRHVFHIECIDRWALSSADRHRVPDCPLCKAPF